MKSRLDDLPRLNLSAAAQIVVIVLLLLMVGYSVHRALGGRSIRRMFHNQRKRR